MQYQVVYQPNAQDVLDVREGLRHFNEPFVSHLKETEVAVYALDEKGERIGGVISRLWGNWMHVLYLWIDPAYTGKGIGSDLMVKVEAEAVSFGCKTVMVDTFSFQARPFYEKLGYQCQMTIDDVPGDGDELHFLTKRLNHPV